MRIGTASQTAGVVLLPNSAGRNRFTPAFTAASISFVCCLRAVKPIVETIASCPSKAAMRSASG